MTLLPLVLAWLAGLVLGLSAEARPLGLFLLFLAAFPAGALCLLMRRPTAPVVLAGLLLLGFWRVEVAEHPVVELAAGDAQQVALTGWVRDHPESAGGMFRLTVETETVDLGEGSQHLTSRVLVYATPPVSLVETRRPPYFAYGDRLEIRGVLERPRPVQGFDYPAYLASKGISGVLWSRDVVVASPVEPQISRGGPVPWRGWVFGVRQRLAENLEQSLPPPHSGLAKALVLGFRGGIPEGVVDDFRQTGTSHLLAISGLHVGVLLLLALGLVGWVWGHRQPVYFLVPFAALWL